MIDTPPPPTLELRRPFGPNAVHFLERFPASLSVISSEPGSAVLALAAAADLRRRGIAYYAAPLLDDHRSLLAQSLSGELLARFQTVDDRRTVFDNLANERLAINGVAQGAVALVPAPQIHTLRDLIVMSDAVLARSSVDAARIANICGYRRRFNVVAPGSDSRVPRVVVNERRSIVVWAPDLPAARLGVIAMALDMLRCDITFVCASGSLPGVRATFVGPELGAASLASAACIVDATIGDPGSAIAMIGIGVPLVAASTTGAIEFIAGVFEYDPWNFRSIHAAVARAQGAQPPILRRQPMPVAELRETLAAAGPPELRSSPLVSIVLPTYNRPQLLAKSLDYIAAQTYTVLDVIVVNDAGVDVSDVCVKYPFVRLVDLPQNGGVARAYRAGMDHIRGKYFAFWGDDDWYFPDHFARVVYALEMTGASVAHTQTLTRYYLDRPDGAGEQTRAYKVLHDRPNDPIEMLTGPTMSFGVMLFRREVIDEIGYVDPTNGLVDTDYQLRASARYDFLAIDAVTGQWNYNVQQKTHTHQIGETRFVTDQQAIYAKHPTDLACVKVRRADWLKVLSERFNSVIWPPDQYLPDAFNDD